MSCDFETYLDEHLAPPAEHLARTTKRASALAARLRTAAQKGDMRAAEGAVRELAGLRLEEPLAGVREALGSLDSRAYLESGFAEDFSSACAAAGVPLEGRFPNYAVFPFAVRVDNESLSVVVNRTRVGTLRPAVLVATIQAERDRLDRSSFNAEEFLGALFRMWERLNLEQSARHTLNIRQAVPLKRVYQELLPFRRWRRDYPETFFAFDVQRLLSSGVMEYNGYRCQLERGRSSAGALRLVDRQGQDRLISSVNFIEA